MNSEFRYHSTTGEWVLIAPKRVSRPSDFAKNKIKRVKVSKRECPFDDPQKNQNKIPYFWFPKNKPLSQWTLQVVPNLFPVVSAESLRLKSHFSKDDMYFVADGFGCHDLLITKDHNKTFGALSDDQKNQVFLAFQKRYKQLASLNGIAYVSIFQNYGPTAGASVFHPHYQIIAIPIIPNAISRSIDSSAKYYKKNKKCIHCDIIKKEQKDKKRIIYEDKSIIAFLPFASKEPFQVNIFPKKHIPCFEDSSKDILLGVSSVLGKVLNKIKKELNDPDYNFFIHTAPVFDKIKSPHYHWHIEVIPRSNISAGFELETGVEINSVFPEEGAKILKIN